MRIYHLSWVKLDACAALFWESMSAEEWRHYINYGWFWPINL